MNALLLIAMAALIAAIVSFAYHLYALQMRKKWIKEIFQTRETTILEEQLGSFERTLRFKLIRSGITKKELYEVFIAGLIGGSALWYLIIAFDFSWFTNILIGIIGFGFVIGTAPLYLEEQIRARIKRIEEDLSIFIDLLIIMLEGGSGLNNAIDYVVREGGSVLRKDLLEEFALFKHEYITYGSKVAYENIAYRTGSEAIASMVGFMKLSEETGIGVKTVYENQSADIKEQEMVSIEKKASTMNINLTLVMFLFILPAMIAMIAFPISSNSLMSGF